MRMILRKGVPKTRKGLSRKLDRLHDRRRDRRRVRMRQRNEDTRDPELARPLRREPREHDVGPAVLVPHHFDLAPPDAARRRTPLQRLVYRLLRGQPRGHTLGGIRLGAAVGRLARRQQTIVDVRSLLGEHAPYPLYLDEVDPNPDDAHRVTNTRRRDTRPSSSSTTRYAPLAMRCEPAVRSQAYSIVPAGNVMEI